MIEDILSAFWMVDNIDVKILKSRARAKWNIDALPPDDQYLERGEHEENKFSCFSFNDQCFVTTYSTVSFQYFCLAAVFCYHVKVSTYL